MSAIDRRAFLAASLCAPAVLAVGTRRKIIDTHQHLWDLKKFRLAWIEKKSFLDRDYTPTDYDAAVKGLGIVQAVYLEVDVVPAQHDAEADYVAALCAKAETPTRGAVIGGRPGSTGFAKYIRRFKGHKHVRGLRQVLHGGSTPMGYCLEKPFVKGIQLLGEMGLHFELCMRPTELKDAIKLAELCPDTRFVLDHCGNPDLKRHETWKKDIAELAKKKNVVAGKISGIVASAEPGKWKADDLAPVVRHTLEVFGPDRVMFGSDWPVCLKAATIEQWLKALDEIVKERKAEDNQKLYHDNALKVYRLA